MRSKAGESVCTCYREMTVYCGIDVKSSLQRLSLEGRKDGGAVQVHEEEACGLGWLPI